MNTFMGCEPEALEDLAERMLEGAERLLELIERLRDASAAVAWTGPDADAHRQRTASVAAQGTRAGAQVQGFAADLQEHAAEQEAASAAEAAPPSFGGLLRGEMPHRTRTETGTEGGASGLPGPGRIPLPPLRGRSPLEDPGPWIGGPFMHRDTQRIAEELEEQLKGFPGGPWIGGPLMPPGSPAGGPRPPAEVQGPLPEGESFALDPEVLAGAEQDRRLAVGGIPVVGTVQTMIGVQAAASRGFDRAEQSLEEAGYGHLDPVLQAFRLPNRISEMALGEKSVVSQVATGIDKSWANVLQTGDEVSAAVGDGDLAAALRAGERGLHRGAQYSAEMLTATPLPAIADSGADMLAAGADGARRWSPEAAAGFDRAEAELRGLGESVEQWREDTLDAESWYDRRRRHVPMPWDPQG
ncbi:hypothetical protein [Brachybacterium aquaticum]|uniref:Uncharacterized protein n=1 Tax=Brachybacterium aquaticum TaxID=1432564 RepID=A0A841AES9_9MICO|nr:hypothetical protein [Brachybacterium aquaticum]MBB5831782.1 hypothetical protein [Brachybacterium aquaticum]